MLGTYVIQAQMSPAVSSGQTVDVTYNFYSDGSLTEDYKVFVHFVDPSGRVRFQDDHYPTLPTSSWQGGVSYTRQVRVPERKPNGQYKLLVGLSKPGGRVELQTAQQVTDEGQFRYQAASFVLSGEEDTDILPVYHLAPGQEIQSALNGVAGGGTLIFEPGVHEYSHTLSLNLAQDVRLKGWGAQLHAQNPREQALFIANSTDIEVIGFAMYSDKATDREQNSTSCAILVHNCNGVFILNNQIKSSAGAGIHISKQTENFFLEDNIIEDTLADGIHCTDRVSNGRIYSNTVRGTGDDAIALVGYVKNGGRIKNIIITDNTVINNRWGRGITVEGSEDVDVFGNKVSQTSAAGIIVASGSGYGHYGNKNVHIEDNQLLNCNYDENTVHGGIYVSGREGSALDTDTGEEIPFYNEGVLIEDNQIAETVRAAHIRINFFNKDVRVLRNIIMDTDSSRAAMSINPAVQAEVSGNTYNGEAI